MRIQGLIKTDELHISTEHDSCSVREHDGRIIVVLNGRKMSTDQDGKFGVCVYENDKVIQ